MTKLWDENWPWIVYYYKEQGKPLKDVQKIMEREHGFKASARAYRTQFVNRDIRKYNRRNSTGNAGSTGTSHDQRRSISPRQSSAVQVARDTRLRRMTPVHDSYGAQAIPRSDAQSAAVLSKHEAAYTGSSPYVPPYPEDHPPYEPSVRSMSLGSSPAAYCGGTSSLPLSLDDHTQYEPIPTPTSSLASSPKSTKYATKHPVAPSLADYILVPPDMADSSRFTRDAHSVSYASVSCIHGDQAPSFLPGLKRQEDDYEQTGGYRPWSSCHVDYGFPMSPIKAPMD